MWWVILEKMSAFLGYSVWILDKDDCSLHRFGDTDIPGFIKDSYLPEISSIITGLSALLYLCYQANICNCLIYVDFDNYSFISQCIHRPQTVTTTVPDSDIFWAIYRLILYLSSVLSLRFTGFQIKDHADDHCFWSALSFNDQLNTVCDYL